VGPRALNGYIESSSSSTFSPPAGRAEAQQLVEVIGQVLIFVALGQQLKVLLDQSLSSSQDKGDLPDLHPAPCQLHAPLEGGQVVRHRGGRMPHDPADLGGGSALEGQTNNADAMGQDRADVVDRAS